MTEINSITAVHQRELSGYEKTIERGLATFIEVGNALKEIRDKKLYKLTHKSFESYVQERWGWKRHYAYNLIESAEVSENVDNCQQIENVGQAREVAKAPEDKQTEVVEQAVKIAEDEGRKPTAKDFAKAREIVCEQSADADLEYVDVDDSDAQIACEVRGVGVRRAHDAIACLKKIPQNDALRNRAFEIVADYIALNRCDKGVAHGNHQ